MTLSFLAENPVIAAHLVLVAIVAFVLGLMVGDCLGFKDGIKIVGKPDNQTPTPD